MKNPLNFHEDFDQNSCIPIKFRFYSSDIYSPRILQRRMARGNRKQTKEVDRYLVRISSSSKPLSELALLSVIKLIDQIRRLHTANARSWLQRFLPPYVRELILTYVTWHMNESTGSETGLNRISKFWSLLFSHQLQSIHLPLELDDKIKSNIVLYLGSGYPEAKGGEQPKTATLSLSISGILGQREERSLMTHLRFSNLLTVFSLRRGATNDILAIIGANCPLLQEINVTGSQKVNDIGIAALLGVAHQDLSGNQTPNKLSRNLRFAKLRSTGVRGIGIRLLFQYARNLHGIRCSSYDVLQSLALHLKDNGDTLPLRFLDFSNCFSFMSKFVNHLPNLREVRIGSDAPPTVRRTQASDDLNSNHQLIKNAACDVLPQLEELVTLVLKDFGPMQGLFDLLTTSVGPRLRRLDLHFMNTSPEGVNLWLVNGACPNLEQLTICDSLLSWEPTAMPMISSIFESLTVCKFLRVTYATNDIWEVIPRNSTFLKVLHLESDPSMDDAAIDVLLNDDNKLEYLEEFQVIGPNNHLTFVSLLRLAANRPRLRWIGDMRDWDISDHSLVRQRIKSWQSRRNEPKTTINSSHATSVIVDPRYFAFDLADLD